MSEAARDVEPAPLLSMAEEKKNRSCVCIELPSLLSGAVDWVVERFSCGVAANRMRMRPYNELQVFEEDLEDDYEDHDQGYIDDVIGGIIAAESDEDVSLVSKLLLESGANADASEESIKNEGLGRNKRRSPVFSFREDLPSPMSNLPQELINHIVSFLSSSPRDLIISARVCKRWHEAAMDRQLWKQLCFRRFKKKFWNFPLYSFFESEDFLRSSCERVDWIRAYRALKEMLNSSRKTVFASSCALCTSRMEISCVMKPATFSVTFPHRRLLKRDVYIKRSDDSDSDEEDELKDHQNGERQDNDNKPKKKKKKLKCKEESEEYFESDTRDFNDGPNGIDHRIVLVSERCKKCGLTQRTQHPCDCCLCDTRHSDRLFICGDCKRTFICMSTTSQLSDTNRRSYCSSCDRNYLIRTMDDQFGL